MKLKTICYTLTLSLLVLTVLHADDFWISKAHQYTAISDKPDRWSNEAPKQKDDPSLYELLETLPPPENWEMLRKSYAESLPNKGTSEAEAALIQLLLAYLDGDTSAINSHLKHLEIALKDNELYQYQLNELKRLLYAANKEEDSEKIVEQFESELEGHGLSAPRQKSLAELVFSTLYPVKDIYLPSIQVPDLVTLVGEERASTLLGKALRKPVKLYFNNADATLRIAQELALEHHDELAAPQWSLTHSIAQVELYELMRGKFPNSDRQDYNYELNQARGYYFWGLVAAERAEDAIALIEATPDLSIDSMPYDAIDKLKDAGYGKSVWKFLDSLLVDYPTIDLWDVYMQLSAEYGKSDQMLETVKGSIAADESQDTPQVKKYALLASAYLSANELEKGIKWLKKIIDPEVDDAESIADQLEAALRLAEIGNLLENSDWLETGLAGIHPERVELRSEYGGITNEHLYLNTVRLYQKLEMHDQAIALVDELIERIEAIGKGAVADRSNRPNIFDPYQGNSYATINDFRHENRLAYQNALIAKMGLLVAKEDYTAARNLLDQNTLWNSADVADLLDKTDVSPQNNPFGWLVAKTQRQKGESGLAADTLEALLRAQNGFDPAYSLYIEIRGSDAIDFLDKLYTLDKFQERPLIWKAQLLLADGNSEAAETIAKKAIEIDPSDGEQPKNDRMRVYDVMRQIKAAQGKKEEAAFFADVLKAIRLSEEADDYHRVGLHGQAIEKYLKSLEFFQDAYCIQSRVAVRLYDEGRVEEALEHYRKAYELMPSSFGLVESHCFGCENVFKGEEPQSIADEVFSGLLETQPKKPQVHYLMGYLRDYQEREADALRHFRNAVALNLDYLNAWKKISELSEQMSFSNEEKDELILKIYALDPLSQHSSPQLSEVKNIKAMWQAVLNNQKTVQLIPEREAIYPLAASAKLNKSYKKEWNFFNYNRTVKNPVDVLQNNQIITTVESLFTSLSHPVVF